MIDARLSGGLMQRPRTPSKLSESMHRRLNSYALAATAVGVGSLALTQPAEAKIFYTPAHVVIHQNEIYYLDLNHDGLKDFQLSNNAVGSFLDLAVCPLKQDSGHCGTLTSVRTGYAVWGKPEPDQSHFGFWKYASALPAGFKVRSDEKHFLTSDSSMMRISCNSPAGCVSHGPWKGDVSNRYLGFKFLFVGETHYGWARLKVLHTSCCLTETLTGYAWETIPNKPIITGKTHGPDVITVEPASLGHLARGAASISAWRQR
jgi:hypothetical protein